MLAVVHHLKDPLLGHAREPLARAGLETAECAPYRGDTLPELDHVDAIVSLGGDQSVLHLDRDPALAAEAAWLAEAVRERGIPTLGVCLGAQLLAHALGGRVVRLPRPNLTWMPLVPTASGRADALTGRIPPAAHGVYWHEDGFEPPPGSVVLLERAGGPSCVAFRFGATAWGVQFHPEVDADGLDGWYADDWPPAAAAGVDEAQARALDRLHLPAQPALAEAIFAGFADVVLGRTSCPRRGLDARASAGGRSNGSGRHAKEARWSSG